MTTNDRRNDHDEKIIAAPMPPARFEALIASYGAEPDRWPDAERAAAEKLVERNAEAREALTDAAILDRLLDSTEAPPPSDELARTLRRRFLDTRHSALRFLPAWRIPWSAWMPRPAVALAGIAVLVAAGLAVDRWMAQPAAMASGPILVRVLPPIELSEEGFVEGDDRLEPEIALIDPTVAAFPGDGSLVGAPRSEPVLAFAPSLEELPLE